MKITYDLEIADDGKEFMVIESKYKPIIDGINEKSEIRWARAIAFSAGYVTKNALSAALILVFMKAYIAVGFF